MSKKKNTLKDLDDFLKQQAATLVSPARLSEQIETPQTPPPAPVAATPEVVPAPVPAPVPVAAEISNSSVFESIKALAAQEGTTVRKKIYDIILEAAAHAPLSAEDTMLINTVLYLKSGDNWKDVIRDYWKNR